jgi:hypothetical protein
VRAVEVVDEEARATSAIAAFESGFDVLTNVNCLEEVNSRP